VTWFGLECICIANYYQRDDKINFVGDANSENALTAPHSTRRDSIAIGLRKESSSIHPARYPLAPAIPIGHVIAWPSLPVTCSSCAVEKVNGRSIFVALSRRYFKVKWESVSITGEMVSRGKTPRDRSSA
jgi:hypothetical protein